MSLLSAIARRILPAIARLAAVTVTVDDSKGWQSLAGTGPADRAWSELYTDLLDGLEAWRKNFTVRRIVTLTRSYVVAGGIAVGSRHRDVDRFCKLFWEHPQNRMSTRLGQICDELTRAGEVFVTLHTNAADGMSYVRLMPASEIDQVITAANDYETETGYHQSGLPGATWAAATETAIADITNPVMLHFAVNKPAGATRGESDLTPILKWALRYSNWLEDRIRLNRIRTRQGLLEIKITEDTQVESKRQQLLKADPLESGIYVHGSGEDLTFNELRLDAQDASNDGQNIRLAIACGSNLALHYMGEGESTNYASAKEMGEPTSRFFGERQDQLRTMLIELVTVAFRRFAAATGRHVPEDLKLYANASEVARADNQNLATAAKDIVTALAGMKQQGWIDDATAVRLAFKFAGETIGEEEIKRILAPQEKAP